MTILQLTWFVIGLWVFSFLGLIISRMVSFHRHQLKLISLLKDDGEPKRYLEGMDKLIKKIKNPKHRDMFLVNKSAGLVEDGKFQEAYDLLITINPDSLPTRINALYYNNLLCAAMLLEKYDEAKTYVEKLRKKSTAEFRDKNLKYAFMDTIASYEFYLGNIEESKSLFTELLTKQLHKVSYADVNYHLGLIEHKQGNLGKAKEHFDTALQSAGNTYIRERITEALAKI